jgi:hypothetical protein
MTYIPTQPLSLNLKPLRKIGLRKLSGLFQWPFRSRTSCEIDSGQVSDHLMRDLGADRSFERQHPSTMGRMF